jgi:DNA-binding transcriptional LysR family regulator
MHPLFIAVAEERSLSAAARTIRSTPSTVSRRISAVEMEFGAKLISRTTRQLSLTTAGQIVLERSRQIVRDIDALRDEVIQAQEKPTGTLKISASVGFGGRYVAPLLRPPECVCSSLSFVRGSVLRISCPREVESEH